MAKKKKPQEKDPRNHLVAQNRRARHEYEIEETWEAGLVLTGTEVKACRDGHVNLTDGYAYVDRGEAWIDNVFIPEYSQGTWTNHFPRRKRKLLLHRHQIVRMAAKSREKGYTLVPLKMYFKEGRLKIELGLGRGKKEWDKRQALREAQDKREMDRAIKAHARR